MINNLKNEMLLPTPLHYLGKESENDIYVKRDDMTGFAFGGNKARKNYNFFKDLLSQNCNHVITYGASQSNHCRIVAAMAKKHGIKCTLILAESKEGESKNANFLLYNFFQSKIIWTETNKVKETINETLEGIKNTGQKPYFIYGGAHGKLGTLAYKEAYDEIIKQSEKEYFDYIFLATGTGATQAGLLLGNKENNNKSKIIGISIARSKTRGLEVLQESIEEYGEILKDMNYDFLDEYIGKGYGDAYPEVVKTVEKIAFKYNLMLDTTYTGKAFYGMLDFLKKQSIKNKKILFVHTGGTPLIFKGE